METKDLEEYLGIVVDLEKNIYMQNQLMENLQRKISALAVPGEIIRPVQPPKPKHSFLAAFFATIFVAVLFALSFFCEAYTTFPGIFIIIPAVFFSLLVVIYWCGTLGERWHLMGEQITYEENLEKYQEDLLVDQERLLEEDRQKQVLLSNLQQLKEQHKATAKVLTDVYSLDIIYGKYRTFPQVCSLYEYIRSGRCTTLREEQGFGSGGAYNLLEQETLQKTIILQLNQIIQHLDAIQANQYMLYNAIQESNRKMDEILTGIGQLSNQIYGLDDQQVVSYLKQLEKNSAITAYSAERLEKELSYMNRMNYFSGKYDAAGMLLHRPPV